MSSDPPETPMHSGDTEGSDSKDAPSHGEENIGSCDSQEEPTHGDETTGSDDSQEKPTHGDETTGSDDPQEKPTNDDETTETSDSQEEPTNDDETFGSGDPQEIQTHGDEITETSDSQEKSTSGDETIGSGGDSQEIPTDGEETMGSGDPQPPELPPETTSSSTTTPRVKLSFVPDRDHIPDSYDDPKLEFTSELLSQLEMHLPTELLMANKDEKAKIMSDILGKYISREDCANRKNLNRYKQKINFSFRPYYQGLYEFQATHYIDPYFREAIRKKELASFKGITKPSSGIYIFQLLTPKICDLLVKEVEHFRKWARESNFQIREATTVLKDSVVLDDFGLDGVLRDLINHYICPFVEAFFPEMRGIVFDSHHGFIVEYTTENKNADEITYSNDSDITLDICLSDKQSVGGEFFFRGTRCEKHETTMSKIEEIFEYRPRPGQAVLHHGRTRYGTKIITSGQRTNLILWCRSFLYKERRTTYYNEIDSALLCRDCKEEFNEEEEQRVNAKKDEIVLMVEPANQAQVNKPQLTTGDQPANP